MINTDIEPACDGFTMLESLVQATGRKTGNLTPSLGPDENTGHRQEAQEEAVLVVLVMNTERSATRLLLCHCIDLRSFLRLQYTHPAQLARLHVVFVSGNDGNSAAIVRANQIRYHQSQDATLLAVAGTTTNAEEEAQPPLPAAAKLTTYQYPRRLALALNDTQVLTELEKHVKRWQMAFLAYRRLSTAPGTFFEAHPDQSSGKVQAASSSCTLSPREAKLRRWRRRQRTVFTLSVACTLLALAVSVTSPTSGGYGNNKGGGGVAVLVQWVGFVGWVCGVVVGVTLAGALPPGNVSSSTFADNATNVSSSVTVSVANTQRGDDGSGGTGDASSASRSSTSPPSLQPPPPQPQPSPGPRSRAPNWRDVGAVWRHRKTVVAPPLLLTAVFFLLAVVFATTTATTTTTTSHSGGRMLLAMAVAAGSVGWGIGCALGYSGVHSSYSPASSHADTHVDDDADNDDGDDGDDGTGCVDDLVFGVCAAVFSQSRPRVYFGASLVAFSACLAVLAMSAFAVEEHSLLPTSAKWGWFVGVVGGLSLGRVWATAVVNVAAENIVAGKAAGKAAAGTKVASTPTTSTSVAAAGGKEFAKDALQLEFEEQQRRSAVTAGAGSEAVGDKDAAARVNVSPLPLLSSSSSSSSFSSSSSSFSVWVTALRRHPFALTVAALGNLLALLVGGLVVGGAFAGGLAVGWGPGFGLAASGTLAETPGPFAQEVPAAAAATATLPVDESDGDHATTDDSSDEDVDDENGNADRNPEEEEEASKESTGKDGLSGGGGVAASIYSSPPFSLLSAAQKIRVINEAPTAAAAAAAAAAVLVDRGSTSSGSGTGVVESGESQDDNSSGSGGIYGDSGIKEVRRLASVRALEEVEAMTSAAVEAEELSKRFNELLAGVNTQATEGGRAEGGARHRPRQNDGTESKHSTPVIGISSSTSAKNSDVKRSGNAGNIEEGRSEEKKERAKNKNTKSGLKTKQPLPPLKQEARRPHATAVSRQPRSQASPASSPATTSTAKTGTSPASSTKQGLKSAVLPTRKVGRAETKLPRAAGLVGTTEKSPSRGKSSPSSYHKLGTAL